VEVEQLRVLVVEDDRALGLFLQKGLQLEGHTVDWVGDGDAALAYVAEQLPGLIVLDLGLPKRDGVQVLEALQGKVRGTVVLVLSGRGDVEERVKCLNLGADDFLLKPFSFHELAARCRALLRRREVFTDPVLRAGGIALDRMERSVTRDGQAIDLTAKEFSLLEYLLLHRGECVTRGMLLREVWSVSPQAGTNVVDVYINYLRRKLKIINPEGHTTPPAIETVRGSGYRLSDPWMPKDMPGVSDSGILAIGA